MSKTRALVSCTILSLQDSCFIYPCCKGCLSRLIQESKRATCGRCGFTCDLQNVDYRYRLSFKVSRNQDIFGVTVFGGCLNSFFGITAGGLQRFIDLEKTDGTHTVQQLLVKAVEDCFIGRCVIFGLKVPHNNAKSMSGQLVACQIISPCESLMGCTVITYFKNLLQANSHLWSSESANDVCPSQQKDTQSSQRDELNRFDYTPPSCARLDSQPSSEGFTISRAWQSPGLCFPPEAISNQLSRDYDHNIFSPKKEKTRTCKCTCQSNTSQLKHDNCRQDELKNETQNSHRKSFSSSYDMFESSAHFNSSTACDTTNPLSNFSSKNNSEMATSGHCLVRDKSRDNYDSPLNEKSLYSHSGHNICFDLEDAPLSESLEDFVRAEPQISEVNETEERSSCKIDQMIQEQNRFSLNKNSVVTSCISNTTQIPLCGDKLSSPMRNVNICWRENDENDCRENLEIKMNKAETPTVLSTNKSSRLKKMPFSPCNRSTNNRLSFSSKKRTLKRKKLTKSRPSVTSCSVNHEKSKYFGHCAQSEVHSVNCKVKQDLIVFDDHGEKYNCSVDLFASGQSSMDMNLSDVIEISKVNEPRDVNTSEPGLSGSLLFSPCLQSTPVSNYQHSCGQKTGRARRRVTSQCSRAIKCAFKSKTTDLGLSDKRLKLDQLPTVGSESFSGEKDKQTASCNLSGNVNEWSRDLFENSF